MTRRTHAAGCVWYDSLGRYARVRISRPQAFPSQAGASWHSHALNFEIVSVTAKRTPKPRIQDTLRAIHTCLSLSPRRSQWPDGALIR